MSAETQEPKRGRGRPRTRVPVEVEQPPLVCRTLTVKEFGACIGVSADSVRDMIAAGKIEIIDNPAGGVRIPRDEVENYLKRNRKRVKPAGEEARPTPRRQAQTDEPIASDGVVHLRLPR